MNTEELQNKIEELELKVSKLERIEKRRKTTRIFKISIKVIIILVLAFYVYKGYKYVEETYIKPFNEIKEKFDGAENIKDNIQEDYNNIYNKYFNKKEE